MDADKIVYMRVPQPILEVVDSMVDVRLYSQKRPIVVHVALSLSHSVIGARNENLSRVLI